MLVCTYARLLVLHAIVHNMASPGGYSNPLRKYKQLIYVNTDVWHSVRRWNELDPSSAISLRGIKWNACLRWQTRVLRYDTSENGNHNARIIPSSPITYSYTYFACVHITDKTPSMPFRSSFPLKLAGPQTCTHAHLLDTYSYLLYPIPKTGSSLSWSRFQQPLPNVVAAATAWNLFLFHTLNFMSKHMLNNIYMGWSGKKAFQSKKSI